MLFIARFDELFNYEQVRFLSFFQDFQAFSSNLLTS